LFFFETGWPRMASNSRSSCLHFPSAWDDMCVPDHFKCSHQKSKSYENFQIFSCPFQLSLPM
jgi:hypothetical protein